MKTLLIILSAFITCAVSAQTYKGAQQSAQTVSEKLNEEYCTGAFKSADGTIVDVAADYRSGGYFNILDWLELRVSGLRTYNHRGVTIPVLRGGTPAVYIDEIPVALNVVNTISIYDIAMVKVIKTPFLGGGGGAYGAIAIYTVHGDDEEEEGTK